MLPPRACVAAEQGLKEKYMKPATAATLAQGDLEAGTRTATLLGGLTAQLWGGKVEASFCKNRDSGGLVGKNQ